MLAKSAFINNSTLQKKILIFKCIYRADHHYIIKKKPCYFKFIQKLLFIWLRLIILFSF